MKTKPAPTRPTRRPAKTIIKRQRPPASQSKAEKEFFEAHRINHGLSNEQFNELQRRLFSIVLNNDKASCAVDLAPSINGKFRQFEGASDSLSFEGMKASNMGTERSPQVKNQCERLDHLTESLHHNLSKLEERLSPVTRSIPSASGSVEVSDPMALVPVAAMLDNAARGIDAAISRVQRLLDILEV